MHKLLLPILLLGVYLSGCTTVVQQAPAPVPPTAAEHFDDGRNLYEQGAYEAAIDSFNAAVRTDPSYADAHYWSGRSYAKLGNVRQAIKAYQAALDVQPGHSGANLYIGVAYFDNHQYTPAEGHLIKAKSVNPANHYSYYYLAEIYKKQGKCKEPKELYNKTLSLKSDFFDATEGLAYVQKHNCKATSKKPKAKKFEKVKEFRGGAKALKESEW